MTTQTAATILIVDDMPENVSTLFELLTAYNYEVLVARNGENALKIVQSAHPHLILLDVVISEVDSFDICKHIKADPQIKHIPIIFMFELTQETDRAKMFELGGNDYIIKPFEKTEILNRVHTYITIHQLQQQVHLHQEELEAKEEQFKHYEQKFITLDEAYKRFVPHQFLKFLGRDSLVDVQLGDLVEKEMSVLFSDIRGFSVLSEKMTPEEKFDFINIYLGQMEPVIARHNGFIDKYMGDGIMALFPTCADDAVQGAIAMLKELVNYNELLIEAGYPTISIGIGINTDLLMLGTVGGKNRMDSTVIADGVNLAANIEDLTKKYEAPLFITEQTYSQLADPSKYDIRVIDRIKLKGKSQSVMVYEVFDADAKSERENKEKTLKNFEEGCVAYHGKEFEKAQGYFEKVLEADPEDGAAKAYIDRCQTPELSEAERERFTHELFQLNKAYERFIPNEFLKLLNKESVLDVQLGDHVEKEMTILFSDIRGFTALSERMSPQENFDFINIYLGQMEPIIAQHRGFIDKYIGDAIMALFPTSADDAISGAIDMLRTLVEYNLLLQEANYQSIQIGIGLNTGPLMLGTVGGPNRMDGTVIADAVNLAARIENLTKTYGAALLITDQTYQKLEDINRYKIRVIDRVTVKGKSEPVTVYEVFDGDTPEVIELKSKTLDNFEEGCVYYHGQEIDRARDCFEKVLSINATDEAARVYLNRCLKEE